MDPDLPCIASSSSRHLQTSVKSALVRFINGTSEEIWTRSSWCDGCLPRKVCQLDFESANLLFNVTSPTQVRVNDSLHHCETEYHFRPNGHYLFHLNNCSVSVSQAPNSEYYVYIILVIYALLLLSFDVFAHWIERQAGVEWVRTYIKHYRINVDPSPIRISTKPRVLSIDAFRGICIILMVFVNYGGTATPLFAHSPWNGITFADLVFPWFLFNMGLSFGVSIKHAQLSRSLANRFLRRVVLLVLFGLFLVDWRTLRFLGVLQRFAICQVLMLFLHFATVRCSTWHDSESSSPPALSDDSEELIVMGNPPACPTCIPDLRQNVKQYFIVVLLTIGWTAATIFVRIDGCPRGYVGPGGITAAGKHANCTGGLTRWIDQAAFGDAHLFDNPTCKHFDPEGIWSTIPAFLNVFLGMQVAKLLHRYHTPRTQMLHLIGRGVLIVGAGVAMHFFLLPFNKNLWTPSFALLTSGAAYVLFAILYFVMDVHTFWEARVFRAAGQNAILCYVLSECFEGRLPVSWPVSDTLFEQTLINLWGVTCVIMVALALSFFGIQISL